MDRKEFSIDVPWGRIAVVTYGRVDLPLVLFCHGKFDSADTFRPLIELLPPAYHYVTFDLPGCGHSDKFPVGNILTAFSFVPILKIVADHYGERPFILIGHSMGMQIGWYYHTSCKKRRITRCVCLDSVSFQPVEVEKPSHGLALDGGTTFQEWFNIFYINFVSPNVYNKANGSIEMAPSSTMEKLIALIQKSRGVDPSVAKIILERNVRSDPNDSMKYKVVWDQRFKMIAKPPFTVETLVELTKHYNVPVLKILSSKMRLWDASPSNRRVIQTFQEHAPYFKIVILDGNHDIHMSQPAECAAHIIEFLDADFKVPDRSTKSRL